MGCFRSPFRLVHLHDNVVLRQQTSELVQGNDLCVATLGRLVEFVSHDIVSLDAVRFLVFDDMDAMLGMGFESEIRRLVTKCGMRDTQNRQTIMLSAVFS